MKISDVLWKAANQHLWIGAGECPANESTMGCGALGLATPKNSEACDNACQFLAELGMPPGFGAYREFESYPIRQQVRYAFLMFAYEIALEEGL